MKNKILTFIIGILVGAILTTTCFLIYTKTTNKKFNNRMPFENNGEMMPPNGEMREPPAKFQGDFKPQMPGNI